MKHFRNCVAVIFTALLLIFVTGCPELTELTNDTSAEDVATAKSTLAPTFASSDSASSVTGNITLPNKVDDVTVTWASSNTAVIENDGTVTRPAFKDGNAKVTLTATLKKGTASDTKKFELTVLSVDPYSYTITFDSQNADKAASPSSITVTEPATTVSALPTPPEKSGFEFAGWFTKENGEGTEFTSTTTVSETITVYAKWNKKELFTVTGTDGISITYEKSDKLLVQQYYIFNSKDVCIYNIYGEIPETFNYKYVDTGATYTYRIFYKFNDEQKVLNNSIKVEKGNSEFKTNDYATATIEKGVLKIANIKIPEIKGATLNNVNFSLNSGEGGWKKDYDWITVLYASDDEISSGTMEINVYDILSNRNKNPDDYDGKPLWINLAYSFKLDKVDYNINLFENGYFAFTFENPEKDVERDSAVPQDAYYVVLDANNLKEFPKNMEGPGWQFSKSLKHDEPYNKSINFTLIDNYTWSTLDFTFDKTLDVNGKTMYVVLKGKSASEDNFDSIDFKLVGDETHISNINLRPSDDTKYKVYELHVSDFTKQWSEDDSIESADLSAINKLRLNFMTFSTPFWIEAIYLK